MDGVVDSRVVLRRIRALLAFFMLALAVSGVTAFPIRSEMDLLVRWMGQDSAVGAWWPAMGTWISYVHEGVVSTSAAYPFLFYGTDWLAFAHVVIAIAFVGPLRDPVRNVWVVQFGMIACALVVPLALVCGGIRGIPFFWRLIDCSFGVFGIIPLWIVHRDIRRLEGADTRYAKGA